MRKMILLIEGASDCISRKKKTLIKTIHKLGKLPGIGVAFTIRKNGQYTTYQSVDRAGFPPSKKQLVSRPPGSIAKPSYLLPHDVEAQIQQRSAKKLQLNLSKIESEEKNLNGNGSMARVENSSGENVHNLPTIE